jgi:LacI family transcriptional regulator, galactose operon repressor
MEPDLRDNSNQQQLAAEECPVPVRMKDIAQDLGVSLMTVSKALRSHSDISEQTRERVLQRMRELNYQPDWIARSMATGRTYLVGLVLPDLMHSFFAEIATAVARKLQPLGYHVVISNSEEDAGEEQRHVNVLMARKVDGLIIASAQHHKRSPVFEALDKSGIPYVLIDRLVPGVTASYVGVKDEDLGGLATEHLIAQGCRRIAHIRGPAVSTGTGRKRGYERAMARAGMTIHPDYIVSGQYGDAGGYEAMRKLLHTRPRPDGVFCYNDPVAAGALKAIFEAGLRVPEDIAIVGAGNVHYSDLLRVPLSTVDQSCPEIGEMAATLLSAAMESKKRPAPRRIFIPPRLIVRDSSRRQR